MPTIRPLALCVAAIVASTTLAGPLAPPPGPPASTNRTVLNQAITALPYTITQPGSYVLTSDLLQAAPGTGITIAASNVTLDLNGFTIRGTKSGGAAIAAAAGTSSITILNGSILNWSDAAIELLGTSGSSIRAITARDCGSGIFPGSHARVESCTVTDCALGPGIFVGRSSVVLACVSSNNDVGFFLEPGSIVAQSVAYSNFDGFVLLAALAVDSTAYENTRYGFSLRTSSQATRCHATLNEYGFILATTSRALHCTANANLAGGFFAPEFAALIEGCFAADNTNAQFIVTGEENTLISNRAISFFGTPTYIIVPNNDAAPVSTAAAATHPLANIAN